MQKHASPLYLTTFEKVGFPLLFQSNQSGTNNKMAYYPKNSASPNSWVLCLYKEKRSAFGKQRLQRLQKQKRSQGCFNLKVFLRIYRSFLPQNTCL